MIEIIASIITMASEWYETRSQSQEKKGENHKNMEIKQNVTEQSMGQRKKSKEK